MQVTMNQRQQPEGRMALALATVGDMAIYVATRHTQWIEWGLYLILIGYWRFLGNPAAFATAPGYRAMADLSYAIQSWIAAHNLPWLDFFARHNAPGPWRTLLGALLLVKFCAGILTIWAVVEKRRCGDGGHDIEDDNGYWQFLWARRIRAVTLPLAMAWWVFLSYILRYSSPEGSGWWTYGVIALLAFVGSAVNTYRYGLLSLLRPGRRRG